MPTIPPSLRPTSMVAGAITVSQQRDIKNYGSLQAAEQARASQVTTEQRAQQIAILQAEIERTKQNILGAIPEESSTGQLGGTKSSRLRLQSIRKGEEAKLKELNQALKELNQGGAYSNIDEVVSAIKDYGQTVQVGETRRIRDAQTKSGRIRPPEGGYAQTTGDSQVIYDAEGRVVVAYGNVDLAELQEKERSPYSPYYELPAPVQESQSPVVFSSPKESGPLPGQGLYAPIEDLTGYQGGPSTVFTNPERTGKITIQPQYEGDISGVIPNFSLPAKKPLYTTLDEIKPGPPSDSFLFDGGRIIPKSYSASQNYEVESGPTLFSVGGQQLYLRERRVEEGGTIEYQPSTIAYLKDVEPDYSRGVRQRVTEFLPSGAGQALALDNEPIYVTNSQEVDKLIKLLNKKSPGSARELTIFLRDQQAKLKKDLLRYNELDIKSNTAGGLSSEEYNEAIKLQNKINKGQLGTLNDIIYRGSLDSYRAGEDLTIPTPKGDIKINPLLARAALNFGRTAYNLQTEVLTYQLAGGVGASLLNLSGTGRSLMGLVSKASKPFKYANAGVGVGVGTIFGVKEFKKRGDIIDSLSVGLGATTGFYSAVYSKQLVEGTTKVLNFGVRSTARTGRFLFDNRIKGKRGSLMSQQETYDSELDEVVSVVDDNGQVIQMTKRDALARGLDKRIISRSGLKKAFVKLDTNGRIEAIKSFLKGKGIPLDEKTFLKNIREAIDFMTEAGLSKVEISQVLNGIGISPTGANKLLGIKNPEVVKPESTQEVVSDTAKRVSRSKQEYSNPLSISATYVSNPQNVGPLMITSPGQRINPNEFLSGGLIFSSLLNQKQDLKLDNKVSSLMGQSLLMNQDFLMGQSSLTKQDSKSAQENILNSLINQNQQNKQNQRQSPGQEFAFFSLPSTATTPAITGSLALGLRSRLLRERPNEPRPETPPRPISFDFPDFEFNRSKRKQDNLAYHAYAKPQGKGAYVRLTDKPHTREAALDVMAKTVDNTLSARGKIEEVKVKKGTKLVKGDGYFERNRNKFRDFQIFRGRRVPLKDEYIENQPNRLDTRGESNKVTIAQFTSRSKKRAAGLPVRINRGRNVRRRFRL